MAKIALAGATAVLRQTLGILGNLAVGEGSRLFRLREDIVWIESEMRHIQTYLEDADANQVKSKGISNLILDIRDLAYDVEDIMETYIPQLASRTRNGFFGWLKSVASILGYSYNAHNFVMEVEVIRRRVENVNRVRVTYGINEDRCRGGRDIWDLRRTFIHVDEPNVVGFDKHIKTLVHKLHNADSLFDVISIVGMPGLGKTTLAKKVFKFVTTHMANDFDKPHFECSAWVYVSQQPNIYDLLQDIAKQVRLKIHSGRDRKEVGLDKIHFGKDGKEVGLDEKYWEVDIEVKLEDIEAQLFSFLSQRRYMIVIDDIWHTETWDALKNAIPTDSKNGSRIILTSRNRNVGIHVGGWSSLHELQPLDQKNSRKLFFKMLRAPPRNMNETIDSPELENIGQKILERCGGVPLAIVLTVGMLLLRERTEYAWKGVFESIGQNQDQCSEIFALSYNDLPTQLKPCFLYFGLFPEDHEISVFQLINLWVAEGFIKASGTREVEDVGEDYLNHLIARHLIQVVSQRFDGRIKSCRIHDILHGLCIRVSQEINFFKIHNEITSGNSAMRVRRVTTHHCSLLDNISTNYQTLKLRSMLCFNGDDKWVKWDLPKNFVRDLIFLRVLSLDILVSSLPRAIGYLSHLAYLRLAKYGHAELPSTICNLRSLLTLDVHSSGGLIIPKGIWKMMQLRHLILSISANAKSQPVEISLPNLQTLYLLPSGYLEIVCLHKLTNLRKLAITCPKKQFIEALSNATDGPHKLENLRLKGNLLDDKGEEIDVLSSTLNLSRYENLRKLSLGAYINKLPDHDKLPPNLTKLTLKLTQLVESPLEALKKLPKLKILKLGLLSYRRKQIICSDGPDNFPQLKSLEINDLPKLEEFIVDEGAMPRLEKLSIVRCHRLTSIPEKFRNIMTDN